MNGIFQHSLIRSRLRSWVLDCLSIKAKPTPGIHILNGHRVSLENPQREVFVQQLEELSQVVRFIRFEDAVKRIVNHDYPQEPLVAFSFDDGFEECYTDIAPALDRFGVNAAFFVNPNFVEGDEDYIEHFTNDIVKTPNKRPMRWLQIQELHRRGHIIGAHTLDHYMIVGGSQDVLTHQIVDCKYAIEEKLGEECLYFAFPYGRLEHASSSAIDIAIRYYPYVFSQSDYKNYFSFEGKVINRRHFEPDWNVKHVKYFLSSHKK